MGLVGSSINSTVSQAAGLPGVGTVTSVGLALPNIFTVSGSPVTSSGTLTGTLATQGANLVFAGPTTGAAATPTFRSLVTADLPTVGVAQGGTGVTTFAANGVLYGNAATSVLVTAQGAANSVLIANAGAPSFSQAPIIQTSVQLGVVSSATGSLKLAHASSAFLTTITAGNALAARTYSWPVDYVAGGALTDVSGNGTLTWTVPGGGAPSYPLLAPDGTVAAPSYSFSGETNTGIIRPGSLALGVVVNGGEVARFGTALLQASYGAANTNPFQINMRKSRGTVAAPTVITTGDSLGTISTYAYVGATNTYVEATRIESVSTGTISDASNGVGGIITFYTRVAAAGIVGVVQIDTQSIQVSAAGVFSKKNLTPQLSVYGISAAASFTSPNLAAMVHSTDGNGAVISLVKARGGIASESVITSGDVLGNLIGQAYVGATNQYITPASIRFLSTGAIADTTTGCGGIITFSTMTVGSAIAEVARISTSGLQLGTVSSITGNLLLANSASAFLTTVQVAAQTVGVTTLTIPNFANVNDTFAFTTLAQTFTNKAITKRVSTITSSATPTPVASTDDVFTVTALAAGATFASPGTGTQGQGLIIRIKDNGGAQTLAWNAIYRASSDLALPTTTTAGKTMYLGFIYNTTDSKWDFVSKLDNFT